MSKQKKAGILSLGAGKCLSYALTLMLTLAAFLLPSSAMADVAWVEYNSSTETLTFKYGAEKPSDSETVTVYDLNEGYDDPGWYIENSTSVKSVVFDESFSSARPTTCYEWFGNQNSLTNIEGVEYLNTEEVTIMSFMFMNCESLERLDLSTFNTKNVTDMNAMFECCSALKELDLSSFNTASVTSMQAMFMGNYELTTIYASDKFDVTNVMNSNDMFNGCTSLAGATKYTDGNTDAKMANYDGYFSKKEAWAEYDSDKSTLTFKYGKKPSSEGTVTVYELNKDYGTPGWYGKTCTSVVFDKSFSNARPTSCYYWFGSQNSLTSIEGLEYLNTEEVTIMTNMFSSCSSLESLVLSTFNTANVTNITEMFAYCTNLKELDLSNFNTTNVTDMTGMFSGCTALNKLDLSSFNTQRVTNTMYMFQNCTNLNTIYVSDKFDVTNVVISDDMFKNCTSLVGAVGYNASNTNDYTMANYDGYFSKKEAWAEYDSDKQTLTFKYGKKPSSAGNVTVYDLNEGANSPGWLYKINATNVVFDQSFSSARPTTCKEWFSEQYSLTSITGLEYLNTEEVTSMSLMFSCSSLESLDLSNFDTKNVTDMSAMFACCTALEVLDLSSFNTANVRLMRNMFQDCTKLNTIYVSDKFSTAKVDDSYDMFLNCAELVGAKPYDANYTDATMANYDGYFKTKAWAEYDSSTETLTFKTGTVKPESDETVTVYDLNEGSNEPGWHGKTCTSAVFDESFSNARPTTCRDWFNNQSSLTSITGLEYLNTENVTDMVGMFSGCINLQRLDLSHFNTAKVTFMSYMFSYCDKLESLDLSTFNTENVWFMNYMFEYCTNLEELDLSNFNTTNVLQMISMFSCCTALEKLDLSSFNTANVTDMSSMFEGCPKLNTIYVSDKFSTAEVANSDNMFLDCIKLVGAAEYTENSIDYTMANYKTGYFKTYYKVGETKTELCGETLSVEDLTLEGDKDLVVNAPFTATNVSYSRPMTNKWGTLCVPFEVDASSATGTKFYKLESVNSDMITLTKLEGKIAAGTPMLVNSTDGEGNAANISISASSVKVGAAPADGDQAGGWQLVGSFAETEVPDDGYIISKNKFWLVSDLKEKVSGTKSVKTKAMRAWLKPSAESAEAKAHVLSIALDDENETTAVDAIEALTEDTAEIYDLQGRRLDSLQKGLNIVKTGNVTRKVMVK